jgi:hypothetical protein
MVMDESSPTPADTPEMEVTMMETSTPWKVVPLKVAGTTVPESPDTVYAILMEVVVARERAGAAAASFTSSSSPSSRLRNIFGAFEEVLVFEEAREGVEEREVEGEREGEGGT